MIFRCRERDLSCVGEGLVVGILNVTPDSFSDGGELVGVERAVQRGLELVAQGAVWLDIGGESTRPGAEAVPAAEEMRRVIPVIQELRQRTDVLLSVDTMKAATARAALAAGAQVVNDVSGLQADAGMAAVLSESGAGCVLMHLRGTPTTMRSLTQYSAVVAEVCDELAQRLEAAMRRSGLSAEHFMLDPGIGFAKTPAQSLALVAGVARIRGLGRPVMVGPSRKSFIGSVLEQPDPRQRVWGTAGAVAACVLEGADAVRVHDVREMSEVVRVCLAIRSAR
jgi:dihydropteroate synthase